jgi:flagellar protein FlaG
VNIQEASNITLTQPLRPQEIAVSDVTAVTPTLPPAVKEVMQPSPQELKASVDKINQDLKQNHVNLDFSIDKNTHVPVVKVTDASTGDIIMQFPGKAVLAISDAVENHNRGTFLNENV